jgi:hypothetical protein
VRHSGFIAGTRSESFYCVEDGNVNPSSLILEKSRVIEVISFPIRFALCHRFSAF